MNLKVVTLVSVLTIAFAMSANVGSAADTDGDGVPDEVDNCVYTPNGPLAGGCSVLFFLRFSWRSPRKI